MTDAQRMQRICLAGIGSGQGIFYRVLSVHHIYKPSVRIVPIVLSKLSEVSVNGVIYSL